MIELTQEVGDKSIDLLARLMAYPSEDVAVGKERLYKLKERGVRRIYLWGNTKLYGVNILGKGKTSIVLLAGMDNQLIVIKILRMDASPDRLRREYEILRLINDKYGNERISPRPIFYDTWVLAMEYIHGYSLEEFLSTHIYDLDKDELSKILYRLFYKAYLLDKLGVDHGELSRPSKHVIFEYDSLEPYIIDFESASTNRVPHNLTSLLQAVLHKSPASGYLQDLYRFTYVDLIPLLRRYRREISFSNFKNIIQTFLGRTE